MMREMGLNGMNSQGYSGTNNQIPRGHQQNPRQSESKKTLDELLQKIQMLELQKEVECTQLGHCYHELAILYEETGLFLKAVEACESALVYLNMV